MSNVRQRAEAAHLERLEQVAANQKRVMGVHAQAVENITGEPATALDLYNDNDHGWTTLAVSDGLSFLVWNNFSSPDVYLARFCPIEARFVPAGRAYDLETLGELLATSDEDWLAKHMIEVHPTVSEGEQAIHEMLNSFSQGYDELTTAREALLNSQFDKAEIDRQFHTAFCIALAKGELPGNNAEARMGNFIQANQELYDEQTKINEELALDTIEYETCKLQVEKLRTILRILELTDPQIKEFSPKEPDEDDPF